MKIDRIRLKIEIFTDETNRMEMTEIPISCCRNKTAYALNLHLKLDLSSFGTKIVELRIPEHLQHGQRKHDAYKNITTITDTTLNVREVKIDPPRKSFLSISKQQEEMNNLDPSSLRFVIKFIRGGVPTVTRNKGQYTTNVEILFDFNGETFVSKFTTECYQRDQVAKCPCKKRKREDY